MKKKKTDDLEQYQDVQIADMNVEGMPWYVKKEEQAFSQNSSVEQDVLPLKETWKFIGTAMLAALVVGAIILFAFFLLILFCTNVWLR